MMLDDIFKKVAGQWSAPNLPPSQSFHARPVNGKLNKRVQRSLQNYQGPSNRWEQEKLIEELKQEKMKKMIPAEIAYRRYIGQIGSKTSSGFCAEEQGRSTVEGFRSRIEESKKVGIKRLQDADSQYKAWRQERAQSLDERNRELMRDRAAAKRAFEAECKRKHEVRQVHAQQMAREERDRLAKLTALSTVHKLEAESTGSNSREEAAPSPLRSTHSLSFPSEREVRQPTRPAFDLKARAAEEKEYFRWTKTLKQGKKCTIDQSWSYVSDEAAADAETGMSTEGGLCSSGNVFEKHRQREIDAEAALRQLRNTCTSHRTTASLPWKQKTYDKQRNDEFASEMSAIRQKLNDDLNSRDNRSKQLCESIKASTLAHQISVKTIEGKLEDKTLMLEDMYAPPAVTTGDSTCIQCLPPSDSSPAST